MIQYDFYNLRNSQNCPCDCYNKTINKNTQNNKECSKYAIIINKF